jgi:hypothetical protein
MVTGKKDSDLDGFFEALVSSCMAVRRPYIAQQSREALKRAVTKLWALYLPLSK